MLIRVVISIALLIALAGCSQFGKISWNFADKT